MKSIVFPKKNLDFHWKSKYFLRKTNVFCKKPLFSLLKFGFSCEIFGFPHVFHAFFAAQDPNIQKSKFSRPQSPPRPRKPKPLKTKENQISDPPPPKMLFSFVFKGFGFCGPGGGDQGLENLDFWIFGSWAAKKQ